MAQQPAMEHVLVSAPLHKKTAETALPVTVLSGDDQTSGGVEYRRDSAADNGRGIPHSP
jgi:hypothetical protein